MKRIVYFLFLCVAVIAFSASSAFALSFSAENGNLSASVDFTNVGGNLVVTLTNTSTFDVLVPADVLTAVFFDMSASLSPSSAVLNGGSQVIYGAQPTGGIVGGEWQYLAGLTGAPDGATKGISSAGFGLFGSPNFPGPDLDSPAAIDGLNYGILSAEDITATGNTGVTGEPLIKNSVVFTLSGTFDLASIENVSFQYGTALDEPNIKVPEPVTIVGLGFALLGLGAIATRRFKK